MPLKDLEQRKIKRKENHLAHREERLAQMRAYYFTHRAECLKTSRTHYIAHRAERKLYQAGRRKVINAQQRAHYAANPEKWATWNRQKLYGLSNESYELLWSYQKGKCAICMVDMLRKGKGAARAHVDHKHGGEVRALLCHRCNLGLGHFRDSFYLLSAARKYLADHT